MTCNLIIQLEKKHLMGTQDMTNTAYFVQQTDIFVFTLDYPASGKATALEKKTELWSRKS